ncbi:MAG TPA: cation diffusion facilitator family transporter [bacterium]|nr:cation diffusion facilitator family transporter [bacterium]
MSVAAEYRDRIREESRITVVGMATNILLTVTKVVFGLMFNSNAIIADGLHSASDLASDIAVLWGIPAARRPADEDHHYGHSRYETIVTMVVGFLLLGAALWVAIESIATMSVKHSGPTSWLPFWAAVATLVLKEPLYWVTRRVGLKHHNASVIANAWHHRADSLAAIAAAIGIAVATAGGPRWAFVDHLTAVVLAAFLFIMGVNIVRDAMQELSDRAPDPVVADRIHQAISAINGVVGFHTCRARRSAGVIDMDVHVHVAPDITVRAGHDIATAVEEAVQRAVPEVSDVVVHVEPEE